MSSDGLLYTLSLDTILLPTTWAVVVACDSAPVNLVLGAVGWARLGKFAAVVTSKAALTDVGRCAESGATVATTNATLVLLNGCVPHSYYKGWQVLRCFDEGFIWPQAAAGLTADT